MECLKLLLSASFLSLLLSIDREEAHKHWGKSCPLCNKGVLVWGNWSRKIRLPELASDIAEEFSLRFSLCCNRCRKRLTPKSVRFAGRSPNLSGVIALARVITSGASERRITKACKALNVSERTVRRWLAFWRKVEKRSSWWKNMAALWSLSGRTLADYWSEMSRCKKDLSDALSRFVNDLSTLWESVSGWLSFPIPAQNLPEARSLTE
jgi:hypothetical protein